MKAEAKSRALYRFARVHAFARARDSPLDSGFRIHLTRTIDLECASDGTLLPGPPQKSSYLYSPRIASVWGKTSRRAHGTSTVRAGKCLTYLFLSSLLFSFFFFFVLPLVRSYLFEKKR